MTKRRETWTAVQSRCSRSQSRRAGRPGVRAPIVAKKPGNCRWSEGVQEGGDVKFKATDDKPVSSARKG